MQGFTMGGSQVQDTDCVAPAAQSGAEGWWPKVWWSIVDFKIGIIPPPLSPR
jgi:hypothetical protein